MVRACGFRVWDGLEVEGSVGTVLPRVIETLDRHKGSLWVS